MKHCLIFSWNNIVVWAYVYLYIEKLLYHFIVFLVFEQADSFFKYAYVHMNQIDVNVWDSE